MDTQISVQNSSKPFEYPKIYHDAHFFRVLVIRPFNQVRNNLYWWNLDENPEQNLRKKIEKKIVSNESI